MTGNDEHLDMGARLWNLYIRNKSRLTLIEWTGVTVGPGVTFVWIGALGIPLLVSGIVLQYAKKVLKDSIRQ